jgi:hypothetical protein
MANFKKNQRIAAKTKAKRMFRRKKAAVAVVRTMKKPASVPREQVKQVDIVVEALNIAASDRLPESPPESKASEFEQRNDPELSEIERMIQSTSEKLEDLHLDSMAEESVAQEEPDVFDGISGEKERLHLLEEQLKFEQKKAARIKHEMALIKAEFEQEKKSHEVTLREIRKDMHRSSQIEEPEFFSLSRELKGAIDAIEKLVDQGVPKEVANNSDPVDQELVIQNKPETSQAVKTEPRIVAKTPEMKKEQNMVLKSETDEEQIKKISKTDKKKKMMITGGVAMLVLITISGGVSYSMFSKPAVNDELVQEYLNKSQEGEVAGTTDEAGTGVPSEEQKQTQMQGTYKAEEAMMAEVAYADSVWQKLNDPIWGVQLEYPENSVKMVRTESSITFSRKEGYIFRIQMIDTGLELDIYWDQIKATNYTYMAEHVDFKSRDALKLTLQDDVEFPGNKYLVKIGDKIFDIWYATTSSKFSTDDLKRVDHILESLVFTNSDEE